MEENKENTAPEVEFPDPAEAKLCTYNECANGHKWPAQMLISTCPGCQQPIVMVNMVQCPTCNEPTKVWRFRSDHIPNKGVVTPVCKGSDSLADVSIIEIQRTHSTRAQENYVEREMVSKL